MKKRMARPPRRRPRSNGRIKVKRMVEDRHRSQLHGAYLTNYGAIDMMCLDIFWGPSVWPQMRDTILKLQRTSARSDAACPRNRKLRRLLYA